MVFIEAGIIGVKQYLIVNFQLALREQFPYVGGHVEAH